jgi:HEAT repeat protein
MNQKELKMDINELLKNKEIKSNEKTEILSQSILNKKITIDGLISFAETVKDSPKATCIEALEYASRKKPEIINEKCFNFIIENLTAKAPRIKWECAKVIGNMAHLYKNKLNDAIKNLLKNTTDEGTVVRWSAAFALGEILKLKTEYNKKLLPKINEICEKEEKNSIKKIYLDGIMMQKNLQNGLMIWN